MMSSPSIRDPSFTIGSHDTAPAGSPLSVIWAADSTNAATAGHASSRSSSLSAVHEQRTLSFPSSSEEDSAKRSGRTPMAVVTTASATITVTSTPRPAITAAAAAVVGRGEVGVTQGCRQCIRDECCEAKRAYFLKQQCPQCMSWMRVGGNAPPATAPFEEAAANTLRAARSLTLSNSRSTSAYRLGERRHSGSHDAPDAGGAVAAANITVSTTAPGADSELAEDVPLQPPARFGHTAVLYKESLILVFGGKAGEEHYFNDVYQYDVVGRRWSCLMEECTDTAAIPSTAAAADTALETSGTGEGSTNASYATAPPASPLFSSRPLSRMSSMRGGEGSATTSAYLHGFARGEADAPSPHHSLVSTGSANTGSEVREVSAAHHYAAATRAFTVHVYRSALDEDVSSGRHPGPMQDHSPLFSAGLARRRRPTGRVGHTAALYQDTMYILSGEQQGRYLDDMWALDVPSRTWYKECGLPFSPRKGHTMHLLPADCTAARARQDMLVVFGGLVKASRMRPRPADPELPTRSPGDPDYVCAPTNAVLLYYPRQRRWCQLKTCGEQPAPRFYHVAELITGTALMLVFGGRAAPAAQRPDAAAASTTSTIDGTFLNDLHILDVSTGIWRHIRDVSGHVPSPRMCAASVFVNGTLALVAGGGDTYCEDAFEFSLQGRRWRRLRLHSQPACSRPTITYAKDRLIFFGGFAPRTGVLNCTMELHLAPLSLKDKCLQWWGRCAFEKILLTSTQSRVAEAEEERAAAAAAAAAASVSACGPGGRCYGCGDQVTLQRCSPSTTAYSSPMATPRTSYVNRSGGRPTPLQVPSCDYSGGGASLSATASAWGRAGSSGGANAMPPVPALLGHSSDAAPLSPAHSCSPSSPVVYSPLSGTPQTAPSWHDNGVGVGAPAQGFSGAAAAAFCSPRSLAVAPPPAHSVFPSRPSAALMLSSPGTSHAGTPVTVPTAATSSQAHLWPRMAAAFAMAPPAATSARRGENGSICSSVSNLRGGGPSGIASNVDFTNAMSGETSAFAEGAHPHHHARTHSGAGSQATSVSHSVASCSFFPTAPAPCHAAGPARTLLPLTVATPNEHRASTFFISGCARTSSGYVAASLPRLAAAGGGAPPVSAPPAVGAGAYRSGCVSGFGGGIGVGAGGCGSGGPFDLCSRLRTPGSPQQPQHKRTLHVDVALAAPSPVPWSHVGHDAASAGGGSHSARYEPSPPYVWQPGNSVHGGGGGSAYVSPQQGPLQYQPREASIQFIESTSSRASSARSTRSASPSAATQLSSMRARRTLQQLQGPKGPYLLRNMADMLQRNDCSVSEASTSTDRHAS